MPTETVDDGRRSTATGRRERTRQLRGQVMSFGRKRIHTCRLVFILLKLSPAVLDENRC
jgi:hypothetical protein